MPAYMLSAGAVLENAPLDANQTPENLFHPKKVTPEVHNMLVEPWVRAGQAFMAWWKHAPQSRDFWVESENSMICVHMVPRKHRFDPSLWATKYPSLKTSLLEKITQERTTEAIACLSEGCVVHRECDVWQHDRSAQPKGAVNNNGLWVGRSIFAKRAAAAAASSEPAGESAHGLQHQVTMEDETCGADPGARGQRCPDQSEVAGSGNAPAGDRVPAEGRTPARGGPYEGHRQPHLGRAAGARSEQRPGCPGAADEGDNDPHPPREAAVAGDAVMTFGKFRGYLYKETPVGYQEWAVKEADAKGVTCSDDLVVYYANWCRAEAERRARAETTTTAKKKDRSKDPEATAINPVPALSDLGGRSSASSDGSWAVTGPRPFFRPTMRAKRREGTTSEENTGHKDMIQEVPEAARREIQELETKMAVVKQKYGLSEAKPVWGRRRQR